MQFSWPRAVLNLALVISATEACYAAQILGRVQAEDGRPLSSVTVLYSRRGSYPPGTTHRNIRRVRPLPGKEPFSRTLRPGPDGSFVLADLGEGEYTVCAFAEEPYLSSCKWQPVQGAVIRSASDRATLPPIVLRRGAVVRIPVETAGHAVAAVQDRSSPQFNIGVLMVSGVYAGAELASRGAGTREFRVTVPLEARGRLMIASARFQVSLAAPQAGVTLISESQFASHVPIALARGEAERVIALRIERMR